MRSGFINMTDDLFNTAKSSYRIDLPEADLLLYPCFFNRAEADDYLSELIEAAQWSQDTIQIYGKQHLVPRLSAWYADGGKSYQYSGLELRGLPLLPVLKKIKQEVEKVSAVTFNSILANRYRNGSDSVGWHADDEPELGPEPIIASVSFGDERSFQLKHKTDKNLKQSFILPHGSLLIMRGSTQEKWLHQIPKSTKLLQERINLTFRVIQ